MVANDHWQLWSKLYYHLGDDEGRGETGQTFQGKDVPGFNLLKKIAKYSCLPAKTSSSVAMIHRRRASNILCL